MSCPCYFVPPHFLQAIADSSQNSDKTRQRARAALEYRSRLDTAREQLFDSLSGSGAGHLPQRTQGIIPVDVLERLANSDAVDQTTRDRARRDADHARLRQSQDQKPIGATDPKTSPYRAVYDAGHTFDESKLPGNLLRAEGEPAVSDVAANQALDNSGKVLAFYKKFFNWNSIDNHNMDVISSVHFGTEYENAFWDSQIRQMVYGDGGDFLYNFPGTIDVIGHEMTHGVTEHTSPLVYRGQSGALNEHVSDVFGIMIKQWVENETADKADWLIGEGCLEPDVKGVALRSMKAPGTAYNDPRFGKDPQVANFKDFQVITQDQGGVHIFSGIPNKAFYLTAVAFGGYSWEKAGKIWWQTMTGGQVPPKCKFQTFANVTIDVANELYGADGAKKVRDAWRQVGLC